jgi:hypothetical protein
MTIIKIAWCAVCVLIFVTAQWPRADRSDADIFQGIAMLILSFPSGYIAGGAVGIVNVSLEKLFHMGIPDNRLTLAATWGAFFATGYFQWFVFVPYLRRKLK